MASLRKKSGRFYARFYDKRRSPKRKELSLGTSRKDVARRKLSDLERRYREQSFDPWNPDDGAEALSVEDAGERFMQSRSHLREDTRKAYRSALRVWKRSDALSPGLSGITEAHLRPYVYSDDVSAATRRFRYRHLRTFFNWSVKKGHLDNSPLASLDAPKKQKKLPEYLTSEELERLLRAIEADVEMKRAEKARIQLGQVVWLKPVILLAVNTGMRIGELCALRWRDVDFSEGMITCGAGPDFQTKSGHERAIPMTEEAREVLARLHDRRECEGYVLRGATGGKLNSRYTSKRFKKYVRLAKLPERISFHSLRHTAASWMVQTVLPSRWCRRS